MKAAPSTGVITLHFPTTNSLEDLAHALAEGEHALGAEATSAGYSIVMWAGSDCPWFHPGPTPITEADEFRWRWQYGTKPGEHVSDLGFDYLPF